jgi:hypothetical protein
MKPQIVLISLSMIAIGIHIARHGKQTNLKYNGFNKLIGSAILYTILYYGGFWDVLIN